MKLKILSILFVSVAFIVSCKSITEKQIFLTKPDIIHLSDLSSASGIGYYNNTIYVVGDDTPWLYSLDDNLVEVNRTQISAYDSAYKKRTPKSTKADFEGAEIVVTKNNVDLVIISSGSSKITRDTAFIVNILGNGNLISKNLRPLYEEIKLMANLPSENEINIEGVTFSGDNTYLLHRGNVSENIVIEINQKSFIDYLKKDMLIPHISIYKFNLPQYDGVSSGFSGACLLPDSSGLIFTASMEDTKDEINDGVVLGSFVGVIPFSQMEAGKFYSTLLLDSNNKPLEKKLEGISVQSVSNDGQIGVITVCDNDDGTSDIISFNIIVN